MSTTMSPNGAVLRWEAPSEYPTTDSKWVAVFDELKADPGEWGVIAEGTNRGNLSVIAVTLRDRFGRENYEITQRQKTLFARYIGEV